MPIEPRVYRLSTVIDFGQYKEAGYTIAEIIKKDPDYVGWLLDEVEGFELDQEAENRLDSALYEGIDWDGD